MTGAGGGELLELATDLAREAGELLRERFEAGREATLASKTTPTDLVSEADLTSERLLRERLAERRPDDGVLGEEGDEKEGSTGLRWIVDPLDGTINFLFGVPQWAVSVAVADEQGTLAGAVFDPLRGELFAGRRGEAPTLNGEPLPGGRDDVVLSQALVATGFSYEAAVREEQVEVLGRVIGRVRDIRRFGSAALDLAWTAAGRYDAYYERAVRPWDIAAGVLVCRCAGIEVRDLPRTATLPYGILAAAPAIAARLHELVS